MKTETQDRLEIAALSSRWGYARDSDDWKTLADCLHPDARIHLSWFDGDGEHFLERSIATAANRIPGTHVKHLVQSPWALLEGNRCFARSNVSLLMRLKIGALWVDLRSWFYFYDLIEKRKDGAWRFFRRTAVFEKDRLDPVFMRDQLLGFPTEQDLRAYPASARFLCFVLHRMGLQPVDLISVHTEEENRLRLRYEEWLATGALPARDGLPAMSH